MSSNVINPNHRQISNALREAADAIDADPSAKVAFCVWICESETATSMDVEVMGAGFRDDQAAAKYLLAFIRSQGFAK
jgi:hypothetical protein